MRNARILPNERQTFVTFGLDYDDTFTSDPGLWREWINAATSRGHDVAIVTFRDETDIEDIKANLPDLRIIATGGQYKHAFAASVGYDVDIWIEDMPELVGPRGLGPVVGA